MRSRGLVYSSTPAESFAAHNKQPTDAAGEPARRRHAEADASQLHRRPGLRPGGTDGPVLHARPLRPERLIPRELRERGRAAQTHRGPGRSGAPGGRAPQTRPGHLHSHVPTALPLSAPHCVLHQLPAAKLFLRLHAI